MKIRYLMIGLLVAAAGVADAADNKVYKWKDANGIMHFSDSPPPKGQQFDNIRIVGQAAPITSTATEQKPADPAAAAPAAGEPQTEEQRRAQRCTEAKQREGLLAGQQQLVTTRDGKEVPLAGADRDAELAVARTIVQQYCAPPAG
ncbi:DUF4124 domain-containing protein [Tahibacter soli]|jgi:hypothetical protein|uniref:DUF4124 domain-containing protein n=1 Tax=Tahibacter soli TaxID=2983605 RepID=A0A9X3YFQ7_9GAMM|nr:DUF4124 domain-containing protein [Tahibacter soli]MDC8011136.1 DUF4124 domain-containing protein [Tahibacter soli]